MSLKSERPDLSNLEAIRDLPDRKSPHWSILEYCRHLGIQKTRGQPLYWLARVRRKDGGYAQTRLSVAYENSKWITKPDAALLQAQRWFASKKIARLASEPFPVGGNQELKYKNEADVFTVGDALHDYVEWKRLVATRSHFETSLSLINHHIVPRLADLPAGEVTSREITNFCRSVIETPPRRGNQPKGDHVSINELSSEDLRKRKKTVNTLLSIVRIALRMAWENGEVESERAWRCIHRMPCIEAPRHIFLTRQQCRQLIAHCRDDLAQLVRAALFSGCRVSELARMKVCDVGASVFGLHVRPGKNGKSRYILLPPEGMTFFLALSRDRDEEDFLFRMWSGRVWNGNHKHIFKEAVKDAGLQEGFVFHGLRHTYASQLVQAGTPLAVVARQLGHSNTDTVSRTYGHLCCDSIESHLARGFAELEKNAFIDDDALGDLRRQISLGETPALENGSWPKSNFSASTFTGPRH